MLHSPEENIDASCIVVRGSSVSYDERAAVAVVVHAAVGEEAAQRASHRGTRASRWERSQRPLRGSFEPGAGWR